MRGQLWQVGAGGIQLDRQHPVRCRFHPDQGEIGDRSVVESAGVADGKEHGRSSGGEGRTQYTLEGLHKIGGCHGLAVRPGGAGSNHEGIDQAVWAHRPAFGHTRQRGSPRRIGNEQAFKQGEDDLGFGQGGREMRIEFRNLCSQAAMQDTGAYPAIGHTVRPTAGGKENGNRQAGRQDYRSSECPTQCPHQGGRGAGDVAPGLRQIRQDWMTASSFDCAGTSRASRLDLFRPTDRIQRMTRRRELGNPGGGSGRKKAWPFSHHLRTSKAEA